MFFLTFRIPIIIYSFEVSIFIHLILILFRLTIVSQVNPHFRIFSNNYSSKKSTTEANY